MSRELRVAYNGDLKKVFRNITRYPDLENYVRNTGFSGMLLPFNLKFYYRDSAGDVICISNDEELQNCLENEDFNPIKLVIASDVEMAHE